MKERLKRRIDNQERSLNLSQSGKELENELNEVFWAMDKLKQLDRMPDSPKKESIRTGLEKLVNGKDPIETQSTQVEDKSYDLSAPCKPEMLEHSTEDCLEHVLSCLSHMPGFKARLAVSLITDFLKDLRKEIYS